MEYVLSFYSFCNYFRDALSSLLLSLLSQYISAISVINAKTMPPIRTIQTPSILLRSICFCSKTEKKQKRRQCLKKEGTSHIMRSKVHHREFRRNCINYPVCYPYIKLYRLLCTAFLNIVFGCGPIFKYPKTETLRCCKESQLSFC